MKIEVALDDGTDVPFDWTACSRCSRCTVSVATCSEEASSDPATAVPTYLRRQELAVKYLG